ncbi:MAG TPA: DUF1801 domain-containing protein [Candidatus Fimivivens sp.]|nr:DUF1801 domain-containing protein [Candidatus Fimivivens sp.]
MKPRSVEEYISSVPTKTQPKLRALRDIIRVVAPEAEERISYGIPYYGYHGRLAYFRLSKSHVGLYLAPSVIEQHAKELAKYETAKATVRFPLDEDLPVALIRMLIKAGMRTNEHAVRSTLKRLRQTMPAFVREALATNKLTDSYSARPPYQRNDYLSWINRAKREETKRKRLAQMLAELKRGDRYMNMVWKGK